MYRRTPNLEHLESSNHFPIFIHARGRNYLLVWIVYNCEIVLKQLAEFLGCRKVELLNHAADFEELIRRQLIRRRRSGSTEPDTYRIPKMVLDALQAGKKFTSPPICGLTIDQFFVRLGKLISYTSQQEMSQTELAEELQQLIDRNQQLEFCRRFREITQSLHIWDTLSLHNAAIFM